MDLPGAERWEVRGGLRSLRFLAPESLIPRASQRYEVIVVGGGPAGSSFALCLARLVPGLAEQTLVLERWRHPREKYCAGAVSSVGLEILADTGYRLDVPHVPIEGVRVRYGDAVSEHRRAGMGTVVRRDEFDHALFRAAARVGVRTEDGQRVVALSFHEGLFHLRTERGDRFSAPVVIGADGTGSVVRRLAGFPEHRRKGRLYVVETPPAPREQGGFLEFDLSVIAGGIEGYYWDFPTVMDGRPAMSRGIYHMNRRPRRDLKDVLGVYLEKRGVEPKTVRAKAFSERGYTPGAPIAKPGLLLVGEAAGIDCVTGEGIAQGIVFADVAARVSAEGLARGDLRFRDYGARVARTTMARHLRHSHLIAPWVFGPRGTRWASFLASRPDAVALGAGWYEGRPISRTRLTRTGAALAWSLARGFELPRPEHTKAVS